MLSCGESAHVRVGLGDFYIGGLVPDSGDGAEEIPEC